LQPKLIFIVPSCSPVINTVIYNPKIKLSQNFWQKPIRVSKKLLIGIYITRIESLFQVSDCITTRLEAGKRLAGAAVNHLDYY